MVTVPEIVTAMRDKIATVVGVANCHYPAPQKIARRREVVLYWGRADQETQISMDLGQRLWQPAVMAQILTPAEGNTPAEFAEIDALITPIVDLFDEGTATQVLPSLNGAVNRVQVVSVRTPLLIEYAGVPHYGAEIYFSIKFHRRTP